MAKQKGLSARELLTEAFDDLRNKLGGKTVDLPSKALAKIADDSDWHRTKVGYSGYESAALVKCDEKWWAIAFGIRCGDYPADPYDCDIAAVPVSVEGKTGDEVAKEIHDALEKNSYFRSSLIYAMADGSLAVKEERFGPKVYELLRPKIQEFTAQKLEVDPDVIMMDLRPVVKSPFSTSRSSSPSFRRSCGPCYWPDERCLRARG